MSINSLPPASHESEAAFLGSCLINAEAVDAGLDAQLKSEDFHKPEYRQVWQAMLKLAEQHKAVDFVTVSEQIQKSDPDFGTSLLVTLTNQSPTSLNATHYATSVKDKSVRRHMLNAAQRISTMAYDETDDIDTMLDSADKALRAARDRAPQSGPAPTPGDIIDRMEKLKSSGPLTRLPKLNQISAGLVPGHLWVIGGYSSTGKSAFGVNLVEDVALSHGKIMIASTEMSQEQYMLRLLSLTSKVPQRVIRYGPMDMDQSTAYAAARDYWKTQRIRVFDDLYNMTRIRRVAQRTKVELGGLDMLMVDFIQNINETGDEVKDARMAAIKLQALGKELNCTVVAMSQISNAQAMQQQETGAMGNYYAFKGSGAIKDAADIAIMLDRDRVNYPEVLWCNVVKNRHDALARIGTNFDLPTGTVTQMTPDEEMQADPNSGGRRKANINATLP